MRDANLVGRNSLARRRFLTGVLSVLGVSACGRKAPEIIFRVRLTFHFSCPAGSRSFSGVWEVWETRFSGFPNSGSNLTESLFGEAIPMRFDNDQIVFALLADYGGGALEDAIGLFTWSAVKALHNASHPRYVAPGQAKGTFRDLVTDTSAEPLTLELKDMPALVVFQNLADPKTGRFVRLSELAALAGTGWAFDRAEIQVVEDRPTPGASQLLPWVNAPLKASGDWRWNDFRKHPEYFVRKVPS